MHIGDVVGGVALVGVAVLVGIALTDDGAPEIITTDTSPFVFAASSTTSTTSTAPAVTSATPVPVAPTTAAPTSTATTTPATTVAPLTTLAPATTTTIPPGQRAEIAMRVLNGGAPAGAATSMSGVLRDAGFAPVGPADAPRLVDATWVIYAPGRELEAATVNGVVRAPPENVVAAGADDPNWAEFGGGLAVLVVLGPAGT